jgi:hypothetical protein
LVSNGGTSVSAAVGHIRSKLTLLIDNETMMISCVQKLGFVKQAHSKAILIFAIVLVGGMPIFGGVHAGPEKTSSMNPSTI